MYSIHLDIVLWLSNMYLDEWWSSPDVPPSPGRVDTRTDVLGSRR